MSMRKPYPVQPDSSLPGFDRCFSLDPDFPVSISYPQRYEAFFLRGYPGGPSTFLEIRSKLNNSVRIIEVHMRYLTEDSDARMCAIREGRWSMSDFVRDGLKFYQDRKASDWDVTEFRIIDKGNDMAELGNSGFKASRAVWKSSCEDSGEWVYFQQSMEMWNIIKYPTDYVAHRISDSEFRIIVHSFRLLSNEFFKSLAKN